jgi:hypothetical protein
MKINIREPVDILNTSINSQPYVLIEDEAFARYKNLLRSYSGRN